MLKQELIRQIEEARDEVNNAMRAYEDIQDKEGLIHLSEEIDELIMTYMQLTK